MREWLLYPGAASAVTLILHFAVGIGFGVSAFMAFLGLPLLGTLVTADDDLPGGWSNPVGDIAPPWRTSAFWGQLAGGCGVSALITALDVGVGTPIGIGFACVGLVIGAIAFAVFRHHSRSRDVTPDRL